MKSSKIFILTGQLCLLFLHPFFICMCVCVWMSEHFIVDVYVQLLHNYNYTIPSYFRFFCLFNLEYVVIIKNIQ